MTSRSNQTHDTATLLLCRHGESLWNQERRAQGQSPDAPGLTALGREQARLLAERMRCASVDVLVTSDLRRAAETAGYVSRALDMQAVEDPRWREIHLGQWQGLTREQVAERWPEMRAAVDRGEDPPRGDDGETYAQLTARTMEAVADLALRYAGQTVCVVSHGGNVRSVLLSLSGESDTDDPRSTHIVNTAVTVIRVAGGQADIVAYPDASHLDGLMSNFATSDNDEPR